MLRQSVTLIMLVLVALPAAADAPKMETRIGPQGQVIINGRPTVPVAVWVQPTYLFDYYEQLGVDVIINANRERGEFRRGHPDRFAAAEAHGLAIICNDQRDGLGKPAVWAWINGVMRPGRHQHRRHFEALKAADPDRFVMSNIAIHEFIGGQHADYYREALKHTDAVICHVWPEAGDPETPNLRNVGEFVDRVREYCADRPGGEVSIWPDINPHRWRRKDGTEYQQPTRRELRFQIWLALIRGADGVCLFPITFEPFVYSQIPAKNEQEIAWNTRLIDRVEPILTAQESPLAIEVAGESGRIVDVATRHHAGRHTVFVLNGGREAQTVTLRAPGLGDAWALRDAITEQPIALTDGVYSERLDGLALRIWQLVPTGDTAEPETVEATAVSPGGQ